MERHRARLWIPGPTEVRPELLAECARPMIGHRSAAMEELIERIDAHLPHVFGLARGSSARLAVHSCTASGLMEAALRGVTGRVLCLVNGAFSERFAVIGESLGLEVVRETRPPGAAFRAEDVRRAVEPLHPLAAVTYSASETSTGAATHPAEVATGLAERPEVLVVGDFVTWLGGAAIDFDAHRLDVALAGTQKALALPPGLGLLAASERYYAAALASERRGWFLDPVLVLDAHRERKPPMTPTLSLYYALARQLEDVSGGRLEAELGGREVAPGAAGGWRARFERHATMRAATHAWAREHELASIPREDDASPTVACLDAGGRDVAALVERVAARGHRIAGGYGALRASTIRIGHMGDHRPADLARLLGVLGEALDAAQ